MIKVNIIKNEQIIGSAVLANQQLANQWVAKEVTNNSWGKPERWILVNDLIKNNENVNLAIGQRTNVDGKEPTTEYHFAAEYQIQMTDITNEVQQEQTNRECRQYLKDTDWYIIRELDCGIACPPEIRTLRADARRRIV